MLKRQTVSVSVAARRGPASGLRRSAAGSGAPGRGGSRSPREPPAISRSARPARIRSGIGTELALSGSTGATAVVSVGGSSEPSEGSRARRVGLRAVRPRRVRRRHGARRRVGSRGRCGLAALAVLERALDVVLRARVVAHVARQDLDRVVVAVEGVGPVDAAVVVPVVDHLAAARLGGAGGRRDREHREERSDDDEYAKCASDWLVGGGGDQGRRSRVFSPRTAGNGAESLGRH